MQHTRAEWRNIVILEIAQALCAADAKEWSKIGLLLQNQYLRYAEVAVDIVLKYADEDNK